jgi:hypothetical protein
LLFILKGLGIIAGGFNHRTDCPPAKSPEGTMYNLIRALQIRGKQYSAPSGLKNGWNPVPVVKTTGYTTSPFQGNQKKIKVLNSIITYVLY